jgi:hypothetical protein
MSLVDLDHEKCERASQSYASIPAPSSTQWLNRHTRLRQIMPETSNDSFSYLKTPRRDWQVSPLVHDIAIPFGIIVTTLLSSRIQNSPHLVCHAIEVKE